MRATITAVAIDAARLVRAVNLDADPLDGRRYMITGGARTHLVDLDGEHEPDCDCLDFVVRRATCKHIARALLAEGDPRIVAALRLVVKPA